MYCKRCYDLRIGSYKQLNRVFHYWYCKYCDAPYYNKPDADLHEKTCEQMPKKVKKRMVKKQWAFSTNITTNGSSLIGVETSITQYSFANAAQQKDKKWGKNNDNPWHRKTRSRRLLIGNYSVDYRRNSTTASYRHSSMVHLLNRLLRRSKSSNKNLRTNGRRTTRITMGLKTYFTMAIPALLGYMAGVFTGKGFVPEGSASFAIIIFFCTVVSILSDDNAT